MVILNRNPTNLSRIQIIKILIALFLLYTLSACSTISYYGQSIQGQVSLLFNRQDINEVLNHPDTPDKLKINLQQAISIRQYASARLALPNNKSYLNYVDVERPYVVWNVFAAPEFSLTPKSWCYPIVGCVSYRGYFAQEDATYEASKLQEENFDVHVGGIAAYSTLGWFDDPLMNTMLHWKQRTLAGLIFHELSHQLIYIKNETSFNEAFSSSVERLGTIQWILESNPQQLNDYLVYLQAQSDFRNLLLNTRQKLEILYKKPVDSATKREQKQDIIQNLNLEYTELKTRWPENIHFDSWFKKPINNARLTSSMTYLRDIPAFFQFFVEQKGQWPAFYEYVINLEDLNKEERDKLIEEKRLAKIDYPLLVKLIRSNTQSNNLLN